MIFFSEGKPDMVLSRERISILIDKFLGQIGNTDRVLILPPDVTRFYSYAGEITVLLYEKLRDNSYIEIMPAIGTHLPLTAEEIDLMYPGIPHEVFRVHDWKNEVTRLGTITREQTIELTGGIVDYPIHCEINRTLVEGRWNQIISVGQIVPHELAGIANYNKNILVGVGGKDTIDKSHFAGALYGAERLMGHPVSPVRHIFNFMSRNFISHLPIKYIMTVRDSDETGQMITRGIFAGDDEDSFLQGASLCQKVNIKLLDKEYMKIVAWLDPEEFKSVWVGNKAIFRTRMALADGGELLILAPGILTFGEDSRNDQLIRKYGYQDRETLLKLVRENKDLSDNLTPVSHMLISSPENRFKITYAVRRISRNDLEKANCNYADFTEMKIKYNPENLKDGENTLPDGEEIYYVSKPAQGLWASKYKFLSDD